MNLLAVGLSKSSQKPVACHHDSAVVNGSDKFDEILPGQRLVMLQFVEHHCVVHIEDDAGIETLHPGQLEWVKRGFFLDQHHIVLRYGA